MNPFIIELFCMFIFITVLYNRSKKYYNFPGKVYVMHYVYVRHYVALQTRTTSVGKCHGGNCPLGEVTGGEMSWREFSMGGSAGEESPGGKRRGKAPGESAGGKRRGKRRGNCPGVNIYRLLMNVFFPMNLNMKHNYTSS